MASDIKEITLDGIVTEDKKKVKEIIRDTVLAGEEDSPTKTFTDLKRKYTSANTNPNLYRAVVDIFSDSTRNTSEQIKALEAYETALSVFRASALEIRKVMDILTLEGRLAASNASLADLRKVNGTRQKNDESTTKAQGVSEQLQTEITDAVFFSNRYALHMAGQVGLALLNAEPTQTKNKFSFGGENDRLQNNDKLTGILAGFAVDDVTRVTEAQKVESKDVTDAHLVSTLENTFTSWVNQFNWKTLESIAEKHGMEKIKLKFGNYSMTAGEFKKKYTGVIIDSRFKSRKSEIIGNAEYVARMWKELKKVTAWDEEKQENPLDAPITIYTHGEPGGGKTFTAGCLIRELGDLCDKLGIPLLAFNISITDFATKFMNESPQKFKEYVIDRVNAHKGPAIGYFADVDRVIPSDNDSSSSNEDQKLLSVMFTAFDGTAIPKGKFIGLMDANNTDRLGRASKSRLTSSVLLELKRFDKPEEFAEYAKRYMVRGGVVVDVKESEWIELGRYLLETPLSNREITNQLNNLRCGFDLPDEKVGASYDEKVRLRNEYTKTITKKIIIDTIEKYRTTVMGIEREEYAEDRRAKRTQLLKSLATKPNPTDAATAYAEAKGNLAKGA